MDTGDHATLTEAEMRELEEFIRSLAVGFVETQFKEMQIVQNDDEPRGTESR